MSLLDEWQEWHRNDSQRFINGNLWHEDQLAGRVYSGVIERIEMDPDQKEAYFYTSQMKFIGIDQKGQPYSEWELDTSQNANYLRVPVGEESFYTSSKLTLMPDGSLYFPYGHAWIMLLPATL